MATAVATPATPKTTTSVDPLYTEALAQAKAALDAQTAPIQGEQAASDANFQQQETDTTGAAAALSKLLQPIGPAVNDMYQGAAQNQELAANGFSAGMKDALQGNTDNLNAMLQKLGQPAQLDSHAGQAGDVLYALGGFNPGTTFSKQGAAFGSAADLQAGDAILKGQQSAANLKVQAIVADQGFQAKIAELAGNLPGDVQTNYQHLQTIALNDKKFALQVQNQKFTQALKTAQQKLAQAKYSTSVSEFNAKQQLNYAKLTQQTLNQNRDYAVKLANLGIAQKKLQLTIATQAFKAANGGLTQAQVAKYASTANAMANAAWHGTSSTSSSTTTSYDANGNPVTKTSGGKSTSKLTGANTPYFQALGSMMKKGIPVQMAMDALDQVYPNASRPTPDAILKTLGPLAPAAIQQQIISGALGNQYSVPTSAGLAMTDPVALLEQTSPALKPIKQAGFQMAAQYGWGDTANLNALNTLWTNESGWDPAAKNPSSGALGIPQALGHTLPAGYATDAAVQMKWGLDYIKARYGSPTAALAFWLGPKPAGGPQGHWY